jgi:hypothetical protein
MDAHKRLNVGPDLDHQSNHAHEARPQRLPRVETGALPRLDYKRVEADLDAHAHEVIRDLFNTAKADSGTKYRVSSGNGQGSLVIEKKDGRWVAHDFNPTDGLDAGSLIGLISKVSEVTYREAAYHAADSYLGGHAQYADRVPRHEVDTESITTEIRAKLARQAAHKVLTETSTVAKPKNPGVAPMRKVGDALGYLLDEYGRKLGAPSREHDYRDAGGQIIAKALRWERDDGSKVVRPAYWDLGNDLCHVEPPQGTASHVAEHEHEAGWRVGVYKDTERTVYNFDRIVGNAALAEPQAVVIVGGEKCADAGQEHTDYRINQETGDHEKVERPIVWTTYMLGEGAWNRSDWSWAKHQLVILWADNDEAGNKAFDGLAQHLYVCGADEVRKIIVPADAPPKWDAADAISGLQRDADGKKVKDAEGDVVFDKSKAWSRKQIMELVKGAETVARVSAEDRRKQQQAENAVIQNEFESGAPVLSVEDMIHDCVWVENGSMVVRASQPNRLPLAFSDFRQSMTSNRTEVEKDVAQAAAPEAGGSSKSKVTVENSMLWRGSPKRETVATVTFRAGAPMICSDPDGNKAFNKWRPVKRAEVPENADCLVQPFLDHVAYLFQVERDRELFLDWLAHIEQKPGVLPHFGWLHIAPKTGCGRNWLASILARVWKGYTAPNVDLPALLEGSYNDELAGRVLAIVDEVQEGGSDKIRNANRFVAMLNAETRSINPKFGRKYYEFNSCRWLVFSNYVNALPLKANDRRIYVVSFNGEPKAPEYYIKLYSLVNDPEFTSSVANYLKTRDIKNFNPGMRPDVNDAKKAALNASKSAIIQGAELLIERWPSDVITNGDAAEVLDGKEETTTFTPAMRRAMDECGGMPYGGGKLVKVDGKPVKCWILRNGAQWRDAMASDIAKELKRARPEHFTSESALSLVAIDTHE